MRTFSKTERGVDAGEVLVKRGQVQSRDTAPGGYGNNKQTALTTAAVVAALDAITLRIERKKYK